MNKIILFSLVTTVFSATDTSAAHHLHRQVPHHHQQQNNPVKRADVVTTTVYEFEHRIIDETEAARGLKEGKYMILSAPLTGSGVSAVHDSISVSGSRPNDIAASETPSTLKSDASGGSRSEKLRQSLQSVFPDFPDRELKCDHFPSDYGAVAVPWLGQDEWVGLQHVPDFTPGVLSINSIVTGVKGDKCTLGTMCSYACQPGFEKSQWPNAQGSKGQSVGGLFCNSDGLLELTRPEDKQICTPGEGNIFIQNDLDQLVTACRTDYPGTEGMYIPTVCRPGQRVPLTNPRKSEYFKWKGQLTSAQYYINPKGVTEDEACVWQSSTRSQTVGNWAPIIVGAGKDPNGPTFLSIFPNKPTSSAALDFNIEIIGGNSECAYIDGQWHGANGGNGCTTALADGQVATIRYF